MMHVLANPISPDTLLSNFGLAGLAVILFAECGLLIGFFLPGDTILLAAGISISVGTIHTSLAWYLIIAPIAATIGNIVGYWIGYSAGPKVFDRPDSKLFRPEYVARAHNFFQRYGVLTILIARFVPIVRTVATVMAGTGRMKFSVFAIVSLIGGIIWTNGVLLIGYALGNVKFVRDHKSYIDYAVIAVVILSLVPTAIHYLQARRRTRNEA
ncbi:MAG TPA: DedA family protein [Jatrophihabitans sp.]